MAASSKKRDFTPCSGCLPLVDKDPLVLVENHAGKYTNGEWGSKIKPPTPLHFGLGFLDWLLVPPKRVPPYPYSSAKRVVYTCVFGGYDFVLPPRFAEPETDYILVSDNPSLKVRGWKTWTIDPAHLGGNSTGNRYIKFFAHELFPHSEYSCYLDGNLRIIGLLAPLFKSFAASQASLGLQKHPFRSTVADEIVACSMCGKLSDSLTAESEFAHYQTQGFDETSPLTENNVLLRWHHHPALAGAMNLWWDCFKKFETRDQISLPFVRWKTGLPCHFFRFNFRSPNPYLHIYRHRTQLRRSNLLRYCEARIHDSWIFKVLFSIGHRFEHSGRKVRDILDANFLQKLKFEPGALVVDCGASIGDTCHVFLKKGAFVHAFEPNPMAALALKQRFPDTPNLIFHQKAVSNKNAHASFYLHRNIRPEILRSANGSSLLSFKKNIDRAAPVTVETIDLAEFLYSLKRNVAVLKIDIEGAEIEVINHLLDTGAYQIAKLILVGTHEDRVPELKEQTKDLRKRIVDMGQTERFNLGWQ